MARKDNHNDTEVEILLTSLEDSPERDPQIAMQGRANFLAQARVLAPAISAQPERRHIGWNSNFFERIRTTLKPKIVFSTLTLTVVMLIIIGIVFMSNNVTSVSAKQIMDRASAAQSAAATSKGILYYRIKEYHNPQAIDDAQAGTTITIDRYEDTFSGYNRSVSTDTAGKVLEVSAYDGAYTYFSGTTKTDPLTVQRTPLGPDSKDDIAKKQSRSNDPAATAKGLFDEVRSDPRVFLQGKETWTDGSQVYVLVDRNYQTHKQIDGQDGKTLISMMKMVFNAQTYALIASEISIRKAGKDIVINSYEFLANEVLPSGSPVTWDLSDLKDITYMDEPAAAQGAIQVQVISEHELAQRIKSYVLKTIPDGFTLKITAAPNPDSEFHYNYEINYSNPANETFGMMSVGVLDAGFIPSNYYGGSYKTASGLVLNYGSSKNSTTGMLTIPDGTSFLLGSTMTREQVQELVEELVPAQ